MQILQPEPSDSQSQRGGIALITPGVVPNSRPSDDAFNRLHHGSGLAALRGGALKPDVLVQTTLLRGSYVIPHRAVAALGWGDVAAGAKVLGVALRSIIPQQVEDQPHELVPATLHPGDYVVHRGHVTAIGDGDNDRGAEILARSVAQLLSQAAHQRTMSAGVH